MKPDSTSDDPYINKWVYPENFNDPLEMVGRKSDHDLSWLAEYISELLNVTENDEVLDLCCGNGLITREISKISRKITGADYSHTLLNQAREISFSENIEYIQCDATKIGEIFDASTFDCAYMSSAFQYFDKGKGRQVLSGLHKVVKPNGKIAITDIPDRRMKYRRYLNVAKDMILPRGSRNKQHLQSSGSISSKLSYVLRNIGHFISGGEGEDSLGWWWRRDDFLRLATECNFDCEILDQPVENPLHTYRFDALLIKKG